MQFTNISFISLSIFIILIIIISFFAYKKYNSQINFNKKYKLLSSGSNFYIKYIFLILSLFILILWILWLHYYGDKNKIESKWIDIIFILDVSKSMNVADIRNLNYKYTRLNIAKKAIWNYVIKNPNNRFWLVIFAWDAISIIPLTTNLDLFLTMLSWVDYRNLITQGSNFVKALDLGVSRFIWDQNRASVIIFISDWWESWDKINIDPNISKGITYFVIWVWTEIGWKIIKWVNQSWQHFFHKYKWQNVISKLNLDNLEIIASKLNSDLLKLNTMEDLLKVNTKLEKLEKKAIKKEIRWDLNNFSRILTIFSLIFFIIFLGLYIFENKFIKKWAIK